MLATEIPQGQATRPEMSAASHATIAALVVTHNRLEKLRVTVSRLLAESLDYVLVFDNHSSDGTAAWLETQSNPRLIVIRSPENLGGAGGFSRGLRHLVERFDPDWIVVMDDDGRPCPGCIDAFRKLPRDEWDAIGAAVLTPSGTVCEMNRPYRNPFWHLPEFLRTILGGRGFTCRIRHMTRRPRRLPSTWLHSLAYFCRARPLQVLAIRMNGCSSMATIRSIP